MLTLWFHEWVGENAFLIDPKRRRKWFQNTIAPFRVAAVDGVLLSGGDWSGTFAPSPLLDASSPGG